MTPGQQALAALDRALAAKPAKDDHAFAAAVEGICAMRDEMIGHARAGSQGPDGQRRLEHANSVLTAVLGGHFPLGPLPWDEVEKARAWLAELVEA